VGDARAILERIAKSQNFEGYRQEHWHGTFDEYLDIVRKDPRVTRSAYQRLYDMILSYGVTPVEGNKDGLVRYKFFDDPENDGCDAIFGLTRPLMEIVNVFKSAALKYGSERRVLLLHGPVGSSKSTIARLLKRGLERYSRMEEGALFTYGWKNDDGTVLWCPMHEDPLNLIPNESRSEICRYLNEGRDIQNGASYGIEIAGELCPLCRFTFRDRLERLGGDWTKVVDQVVVKRLVLSEQDRIGIGTFQPKDEKNQDSTELTGDINYRKIAEFGSESDPRAFNFDGEFNFASSTWPSSTISWAPPKSTRSSRKSSRRPTSTR
jgi:serine protein kinase